MGEMGKDLTHIAFALIGVATIALLVSHSTQSVELIKGGAGSFAGLLGVVTLQNQYANIFQN